MKAWLVKDKNENAATVVFAETRGKAKALAICTEACEDVDFTDIEARRRPQLDKYYTKGKKEMDWYNSKDRIALVKDGGFVCDYDYWEREDYDTCPAKEYCDRYKDCLAEEAEEAEEEE